MIPLVELIIREKEMSRMKKLASRPGADGGGWTFRLGMALFPVMADLP